MRSICSSNFTYHKTTDTFSAEVSELGNALQGQEGGFYIRSERTGQVRLFLYGSTEYDTEGDICVWNYFSPGNGHKLVIFND